MKHTKHARVREPIYESNAFKIGAGVIGIIILLALLLSLDKIVVPTNATDGSGDIQVIRMGVRGAQYVPSTLTVEAGKPVKWIVDGKGATGCTQYLLSPELGISRRLQYGDNIIEFTPQKKGSFGFSCSMGMVRGTMNVV